MGHRREPSGGPLPAVGVALLCGLLAACSTAGRPGSPPGEAASETACGPAVGVLALRDVFGVEHPDQIVHFELRPDPGGPVRCVLDETGRPVVFQLGPGDQGLALRTALLPEQARRFTLHTGAPTAPPRAPAMAAVRITRRPDRIEITNGLTGVRLPRMSGLDHLPAPLQGARLLNGTWTGRAEGGLQDGAGRARRGRMAEVRVLEEGPLYAVAEIAYRFEGGGSHRTRVEVQAGQPSVLVEEDGDAEVTYALRLDPGLHLDQGRYRGHGASSPARGRRLAGVDRDPGPLVDRLVDLADLVGAQPAGPGARAVPLAVWDPWIADGGWYWLLYRAAAPPTAPVLGLFAGPASRALGAASSGIGLRVAGPADAPEVLIEYRGRPAGGAGARVRVAWSLYAGTKAEDLAEPGSPLPIARQMNLHGGVNLTKLAAWRLDEAPALPRAAGLLLPADQLAHLRDRVRADPGLAESLASRDSTVRPLLRAWSDDGDGPRRALVAGLESEAHRILWSLVEGDGIQTPWVQYWLGGLTMVRAAVTMAGLLADPRTTPGERARLGQVAALFAAILWDEDFVPLGPEHGLHLGTHNMPAQQRAYRGVYAAFLGGVPGARVDPGSVGDQARAILRATIAEDGAHVSAPHYVGASLGPLLGLLQALQRRGIDVARDEVRLARFAEFYLGLLTPPEPRFGGRRKLVAIGDSSTEGTALMGQLGTILAASRPGLAARLMGAWREMGSPHDGFHGSTVLKIDPGLPARVPGLTSRSVPGWYTVLRSRVGTPEESAVWVVHGDAYRDHYHDDQGSVVAYLLGAPVALDWGSFGSPRAAGGFMHSGAQLPALLGRPWDADRPPLDAGHRWVPGGIEGFAAAGPVARVAARFRSGSVLWRRTVSLVDVRPAGPVLVIRDRFRDGEARPDAGPVAAVVSLNLAATGSVETPWGLLSPEIRIHGEAPSDPPQLPSSGPSFPVPAGAASRLGFRGPWGVDWDLWVVPAVPARALLGHWGHLWHPWVERGEFEAATGRGFEEGQYILRILARGDLDLVLAPHRSGQPPILDMVVRDGEALELTAGDRRVVLEDGGGLALGPAPR